MGPRNWLDKRIAALRGEKPADTGPTSPSSVSTGLPTTTLKLESELLERALRLASGEGRLIDTLAAFEALERAAPAPTDLLRASPKTLDGRWSLVATVSARVGESELDEKQTGFVNASGISVNASKGTLPVQEVRVKSGRIGNEIVISVPIFKRLYLRVAGAFSAAEPPAPGTRALVNFDSLEVFDEGGKRLLSAGWLFSLVRALRPALISGGGQQEDKSWLDTTYISERVRLGRGNKGSIFVLERLRDDGGPLASWPL
jgi:hypothetical protein